MRSWPPFNSYTLTATSVASMGQKGREYIVENFSRALTAEKYVKVLETTCEKKLNVRYGRTV